MRHVLASILLSVGLAVPAMAQTAFTYQGRLTQDGQPANGSFDMTFRLRDPFNNNNIVTEFCRAGVSADNGLFTTALDLGPITRDLSYTIEVLVRPSTGLPCTDQTGFTPLAPQQFLSRTPLANHALSASALNSPDGSPATAVRVWPDGSVVVNENLHVLGELGLGTNSPQGRLDMRSNDGGYFLFRGTSANIEFNGGTDGTFEFYNDGATSGRTDFVGGGQTRLSILNNGNVGIGTNTPGKKLTVAGDMEIGTSAGDYRHLRIGGGNSSGFLYGSYPRFQDGIHLGYNYYANTGGSNVVVNAGGGTSRLTCGYGFLEMRVGSVGLAPTLLRLAADTSGVTVFGTFNNSSDRNSKQDFKPIDPAAILAGVLALPLSEWSYKDDAATRHIGPMAQDFHAAFGIGTDDKHIAPLDEGGVAFAAIQGLNEKLAVQLRQRDAEIADLKHELADLRAAVQTLGRERGSERP